MRCPFCGISMIREENPHQKHNEAVEERNREASYKWADNDYKGYPPIMEETNMSESFTCQGEKCVLRGTQFIMHNPYRGMNSAPTDYWSLTWLK